MRLATTAIFCMLCITGGASAQTSQPADNLIHRSPSAQSSASRSANDVRGGGALRMALSLSAVLGLILLMYWATRRLLPRSAFASGDSAAVQVLARSPVSPRTRVVLLRVGRRILVVGESGQQMTTLCEITDPDEAAALLGQIRGEQEGSGKPFSALLSSAIERFQAAQFPASLKSETDEDELASTHQELDGLTQRVRVMARHFGGGGASGGTGERA
jgi:flagellar biosynthetic protein FliO